MPSANIPNAPAAPAAGIGAMFAALLADAPQMPGNAANVLNSVPQAPLPADVSQSAAFPQTDNAQAAPPVNIVLPAMPVAPAALNSDTQPVPADPAMAFVAPKVTEANAPLKDSKDRSPTDPAALPPMPVIAAQIAANAPNPVSQTPSFTAPVAQDDAPANPVAPAPAKPAAKNTPKNDLSPVAALAAFAPPQQMQTAPAKTADIAISDAASAPKQAAALSDAQNAPSPAAQMKSDAAMVNAAGQGNTKPAPAPQTTQAQALPVQFDLASHGQNAQTGDQKQQQTPQQQPQIQQAQNAPPATAPVHASVAPQTDSANSNTFNNVSAAPQMTPALAGAAAPVPVHVNAAIQVSPQTASAPMPYDAGAIAVTVAAKSLDGNHQFDIRLDPPELGSIAVHLSVDNSGTAVAHLTADKPQTLQLLQNDSGNLSRALKDAGLNLANNGLNFSLRSDQRQPNQFSQRGTSRMRNLSVSAVAAPAFNSASVSSSAPGSVALDITV
jgi:flagellar hook-length control protein FliK